VHEIPILQHVGKNWFGMEGHFFTCLTSAKNPSQFLEWSSNEFPCLHDACRRVSKL